MPKYIGYRPTTTASSVTNSLCNVDTKYNSGIWSIRDIYSKRSKGSWPTTTRGGPPGPFTAWLLVVAGGGGGGHADSGRNGLERGGRSRGGRAAAGRSLLRCRVPVRAL